MSKSSKQQIVMSRSFVVNNSLRRTKWRKNPYTGEWQQNFQEQQAIDTLKKVVSQKRQNPDQINLVSAFISVFSSYNCDPSPVAYSYIVNFLLESSLFDELPPLLNHLEKVEKFDSPGWIFVDLIRGYAGANVLEKAVETFFEIPRFRCSPTVLSLDALLSILGERQGLPLVCSVLTRTLRMNIRLEGSSFSILVKTLCKMGKVNQAMEIFSLMENNGCTPDSDMYRIVLLSLCKYASSIEVKEFLEEMSRVGVSPSRIEYSNAIRIFVMGKKGMDALEVLNQMIMEEIKPDIVDYSLVLNGLIKTGDFEKGDELFDEMLVMGIIPDVFTYIYINGLCKQGKFEAASKMLGYMEEVGCMPNVVTYNTLIARSCLGGQLESAKGFLREMHLKSFRGNMHTCKILIDSFLRKDEVMEAYMVFSEMLEREIIPSMSAFDSIICSLCKYDLFVEAFSVYEAMIARAVVPSEISWNSLICGAISSHDNVDISVYVGK